MQLWLYEWLEERQDKIKAAWQVTEKPESAKWTLTRSGTSSGVNLFHLWCHLTVKHENVMRIMKYFDCLCMQNKNTFKKQNKNRFKEMTHLMV